MRALLIAPRFPQNMWTYERALSLIGRKVVLPPLSLITVAALLPQNWEFKLVDRNAREITEAEWEWADLVLISAMTTQRDDFLSQIREAKQRGKRVAVGGPYPTTLPNEAESAGADYLVFGEGEVTIPAFVAALMRGDMCGRFNPDGHFPELTTTPAPRFDLLDLNVYEGMSVQFSRGCPFSCEFCEISSLFGQRTRTKTTNQFIAELDRLRELGWRRSVFVVDDNFIGNRAHTRELLKELKEWQQRHGYPVSFNTEASVDLAGDKELLDLMVDCNFNSVFIGIETPDPASLALACKGQNARIPLETAVEILTRAGLRVMGAFIVGFDGESAGAGDRICEFVERTSIPTIVVSLLQALPGTAMWTRLEREKRLRGSDDRLHQATLMNFEPTRPVAEIALEYTETLWRVYEPQQFLDRAYRHFLMLGPPRWPAAVRASDHHGWQDIRALLTMCWRQGFKRNTRWKWWHHLFSLGRRNPRVLSHYICVAAHLEHFLWYREETRRQVKALISAG